MTPLVGIAMRLGAGLLQGGRLDTLTNSLANNCLLCNK